MPTFTTNYNLAKPLVNNPIDQDLFGAQINNDMDLIDAQMKANADAIAAINLAALYPVGSLYINASVSTNPATLLGFGTWESFGAGRVLIGVGTGTDINANTLTTALGDTGGEYTHALTSNECIVTIPTKKYSGTGAGNGVNTASFTDTSNVMNGVIDQPTITTGSLSVGSGANHNNTQPYISVYMWKRTA